MLFLKSLKELNNVKKLTCARESLRRFSLFAIFTCVVWVSAIIGLTKTEYTSSCPYDSDIYDKSAILKKSKKRENLTSDAKL